MDSKRKSSFITLKEIAVFALLGTVMFVSKMLMEFLPNIHLLGVLTVTYTAISLRVIKLLLRFESIGLTLFNVSGIYA